jgi:glutaredoxin-related protein
MLWTITELMHLTRDELCDLAAEIEQSLSDLEAGSIERVKALTSLDNIRRMMLLRDLHP